MPDYIGRYRAERIVGSGAFATVWLARDESLDSWVAIKVLADNWSHDEEIRRRFTEEARILWRANSEHIVRIHNVEELEDGRPYFVMDFADRGTLQQRMRDRAVGGAAWPTDEAIDIALAIADGLKVAHALGVVHRDLKPGNIMFQSVPEHHGTEREEKLILTDFGMAKSLARSRGTTIATGTPHYMAPEQAEGKADERSDIYAAGVVLYELLAGRVPYPYDSPGRFFAAQLTEPPEPIANLRPGLPPQVAATVDKALASDPAGRWPGAAEWADALIAARAAGPSPALAGLDLDAVHTMGPDAIAAARAQPPGAGEPPAAAAPAEPTPPPVAASAEPPTPPTPPPAAPAGAGGGGRRWARVVIPVVALAVLLGVGIGAIALTGGGEGDAPEVAELLLEPVASVGRDPFTESIVPRAGGAFDIPVDLQLPDELTAVLGDDVSNAALTSLAGAVAGQLNPPVGAAADLGLPELDLPTAPSGQVASVAGSAPGLYGGTQLLSVCDKRQLVEFLQGSDEKARAWASTLGIQPSGIPAYVRGLTDVVLQADTRVTNHGFSGGTATPIDSVLQAGTAVLIDAFGVPRVRCYCGNPLTEPRALTTKTPKIVGKKWPGFKLEKTVAVKRVKEVEEFAIDDVLTRDGFVFREPGTDATEATLVAAGSEPPPPPPPPVENITAQGNVNASTEFPTGEFPARLAVDGSKSTSWFSAGPDAGGGSTFVWGAPDGSKRFIQTVKFFNNALHSRSDFRTGFGFAQVTVAVLSGSKTVFEKTFALPGTPDPNITVQPKVEGDVVRLFFTGHEFPQCGGISEFIVTGRPIETAAAPPPAAGDAGKEQAIAAVRSILNDKAGQCGGLTVRGITAAPIDNGWRVSADVTTFGNDGTAEWNVIGGRATPAEPLAADIENGCP